MKMSSKTYHEQTSYLRHDMASHGLDWANQPRLRKYYPTDLPVVFLPGSGHVPPASLWNLSTKQASSMSPGLAEISTLLNLTCGLTAKARQASGDFYFRSAASAGALYPNEIYLLAHDLQGLEPGVYHHDVFERKLTSLRQGRFRKAMADALPGNVRESAATFFITALFNRSAWKYRARAYRYVLLDAGHVLENLLFALGDFQYAFTVGYDFADAQINRLLGLDDQKEVCLAYVALAPAKPSENVRETTGEISSLPESILSAGRSAPVELAYPMITDIHHSGDLENQPLGSHGKEGEAFPKPWEMKNPVSIPHWKGLPGELSYPEAVLSRRSKRNFIQKTLPLDRLTGLLSMLDARPKADGLPMEVEECLMTGFLARGVEGLENGFYLCDFVHHHFGLIEAGTFQPLMAEVCLGQAWLQHAALHFLFMADFAKVDRLHGSRGYRYVMMEAGRKGQALYAGATALGLGCCGIGAFFDPEAKELLDMNEDVSLCYLVAAGPVKL